MPDPEPARPSARTADAFKSRRQTVRNCVRWFAAALVVWAVIGWFILSLVPSGSQAVEQRIDQIDLDA